jgi:hypothetical protein
MHKIVPCLEPTPCRSPCDSHHDWIGNPVCSASENINRFRSTSDTYPKYLLPGSRPRRVTLSRETVRNRSRRFGAGQQGLFQCNSDTYPKFHPVSSDFVTKFSRAVTSEPRQARIPQPWIFRRTHEIHEAGLLLLLKPLCVPHGLENGGQQRYEADLGDCEHMLGLNVEATDPDGHEHD